MSEEPLFRGAANEILKARGLRPPECEATNAEVAAECLAEEWLREHDNEPLTPEWMQMVGLTDSHGMRNQKRFEIIPSIRIMFFAREGPQCWEAEMWVGKDIKRIGIDRGCVRRLCAEFGIMLEGDKVA